jgi:glycosyltransferase involved in cell wall biosynthesis
MNAVSVVMPAYNRSYLLSRTLDSVLRQTLKPHEVLVVDDHSTENLREVLGNHKVRLIPSVGKGVSAARNTGVRAATGDWIAFLDSDDEWMPEKLKKQMDYLSQNPHLDFIHTNESWIRNGKMIPQLAKHQKSGGRIFAKCTEQCVIAASSVLAKKEFLIQMGLFDESFIVCEDFDFWLRIAAKNEIGFLQETLTIKHGGHAEQLSLQHHSMDLWRVRALAKHLNESELLPEEVAALHLSLQTKAEILLNGFKKYPNPKLSFEVEGYLKKMSTPIQ